MALSPVTNIWSYDFIYLTLPWYITLTLTKIIMFNILQKNN
jgi:hypothetical protein